MNRYLCEPDKLLLDNVTAYHFARTLDDVSLYILPVLALIGNSLTLLVILTNSQLNCSSFSVYVKSLAISDTLVLIFKLISFLNKTVDSFYVPSLCTILVFCGEASVLVSIWIIVLITIERTLVVLFPFHKTQIVSQCRARFIVITISVIAVMFSARILVIPIDKSIGQKIHCQPIASWLAYRQLHATITDFGYCYIPLTLVIIGNFLTICSVKRALVRRNDMITNNSYHRGNHLEYSEQQLMLMLLIVTFMYVIYFVPFTITNVISRFGLPFHSCFTQKSFEVYLVIRALSVFLKDLYFCTNFLIYYVSGRQFRFGFLVLIKVHHRRTSGITKKLRSRSNLSEILLKKNSDPRSFHLSRKPTVEESQF